MSVPAAPMRSRELAWPSASTTEEADIRDRVTTNTAILAQP